MRFSQALRVRLRRPSPAMVVASTALVIGAAGVSWAAIPDRDGTIHGCYSNDTGALRVADPEIGSPRPCGAGETALNWGLPEAHRMIRVKQINLAKTDVSPKLVEMVRLNLPPGRYHLTGSGIINYASKTPVTCVLQSTDPQGPGRAAEWIAGSGGNFHLSTFAEITGPGQYALIKCARRFKPGATYQSSSIVFPTITAVQVGRVSFQSTRD